MRTLVREIQAPAPSIFRQLAVWALTWTLIGLVGLVLIAVVGSIDFGHESPTDGPTTNTVKAWSNP